MNKVIFSLEFAEGGILTNLQMEQTTEGWRTADGKVEVRIERRTFNEETISRLILKTNQVYIRSVQYPITVMNDLTPLDALLVSSPWGDCLERPAQTIRAYWNGRGKSWIYDYIQSCPDEVRYRYPSILAMQYMVVYNGRRSRYLATYSTGADSMDFCAKAVGEFALEWSVRHYPFLRDGEWQSPECSMAEFSVGGWHRSADVYASHMSEWMGNPDSPEWMRSPACGWHGQVHVPIKYQNQPPLHRFCELPKLFEEMAEVGLTAMHVFGWHGDGHDTQFPDYTPNAPGGTVEELRAAGDAIADMGGVMTLYTNARLVDRDSLYAKATGRSGLCLRENGEPYEERYASSCVFHTVCPTEPEFHRHIAKTAERMITQYGARGMQLDQISCNHGRFCFAKNHRHTTPANNYLTAMPERLQEIRQSHQRLNPEFYSWSEGCNERFGKYCDIEQGTGEHMSWQIGRSVPEQYLYTYKRRMVTAMVKDEQTLAWGYCQGKPFDLGLKELKALKTPMREYIRMRQMYPEFFLNGTFMDDEGLQVLKPDRIFGIQSENRLMVNLWAVGSGREERSCVRFMKPEGYRLEQICPLGDVKLETGEIWRAEMTGPAASLIFVHE